MYVLIANTSDTAKNLISLAVVEYQIYNKLFTLVGTFFTLALTSIWYSVTKAADKDYVWIKKLFKVLKLLAICAVLFEFFMIPFLQLGIDLWIGKNVIQVNYIYAIVFALLESIFIWNSVISSIANRFGRLKVQAVCFTIGAIIKIPTSRLLSNRGNMFLGETIVNPIGVEIQI